MKIACITTIRDEFKIFFGDNCIFKVHQMMKKTPLYIKNMTVMGMKISTTSSDITFKNQRDYEFQNSSNIMANKIYSLDIKLQ